MQNKLNQIYQWLQGIEVSGYTSVKSLALAMDGIGEILKQFEQGEIVVRHREEGKQHGTENRRETD